MSASTIWRCWLALILLLAATTASAFLPLGALNLPLSLAIAAVKAFIVLLIFMELRTSHPLVRTFAAAGFFWLLIMIVLTGADYWHRTDTRAPLDELPLMAPRAIRASPQVTGLDRGLGSAGAQLHRARGRR